MSRYEEPGYAVVSRRNGYEIRRYAAYLAAETVVEGDFRSTGNAAFRRLAGFIFGNNSEQIRMKMTVPVTVQEAGHGRFRYRFVMGRAHSPTSLPRTLDKAITIVDVPAGNYAALRYRGGRRKRRYERAVAKLLKALLRDGIALAGSPALAVYSGPTTPSALRKNEVLVPVTWG
jgi:effector-binding domain-containing protein